MVNFRALQTRKSRKFDDSWKAIPTDDVYVQRYYRWKVYSFIEGVRCHKETHHPDIYNVPDAKLHVTIELNMQAEKQVCNEYIVYSPSENMVYENMEWKILVPMALYCLEEILN